MIKKIAFPVVKCHLELSCTGTEMRVVFGEMHMSFLCTYALKKASSQFSERQQHVIISGCKISPPQLRHLRKADN